MPRRTTEDIARTRAFWAANKPTETGAPAYTPDPPVWWHVALALTIALLLQTSFAPFVGFRGANPSFVTLIVAWHAVRTGSLRGLLVGMIAGACEDALAGSTGVSWTFATGLAGLAAGRLSRTWLADTQLALVPGAAAVTLLRYAAFAVGMQIQHREIALPVEHLHVALWQAALSSAVTFLALRIGPELRGRVANRR